MSGTLPITTSSPSPLEYSTSSLQWPLCMYACMYVVPSTKLISDNRSSSLVYPCNAETSPATVSRKYQLVLSHSPPLSHPCMVTCKTCIQYYILCYRAMVFWVLQFQPAMWYVCSILYHLHIWVLHADTVSILFTFQTIAYIFVGVWAPITYHQSLLELSTHSLPWRPCMFCATLFW